MMAPIFIALVLTAQVMLPHRSGSASTATASPPTGSLIRWWVATDISTNGYVTSWVDRIAGDHLTNSVANAPIPVKTNNYVTFDGTMAAIQDQNSTLSWGVTGYSYAFILAPDTTRSKTLAPQTLWTDPGSNPSLYINYLNTNCVQIFGTADPTWITNYFTTGGLTNDIVFRYVSFGATATYVGYLNGTANYTNTGVNSPTGITQFGGRAGNAPSNPLYANVYELLVYTNLSDAAVPGIHTYGTSTYHY